MRKFIAHIRLFFAARYFNDKVGWLDVNTSELAIFLKTNTGQKLLLSLEAQSNWLARRAVSRANMWTNGHAQGFAAATEYFRTLSAIVEPQIDEATDLSPRGERELVETFSP